MSSGTITLTGMTWNHTRGFLPMVATAQRFSELHPSIEITWEKRSLKAFEECPVEQLAAEYDLIVLDHPFVGYAAEHGPLLALDEHLPATFLADQAAQSVGASHLSYAFAGHQWALAIDAAAPVAVWREDLLPQVPATWAEVVALAQRGQVELPAAPINCLMNFYTLCIALGETPFGGIGRVVSAEIGSAALAMLREVTTRCDQSIWTRNPIASHELLASAENSRIAYCPLAYGYSNYARAGYAAHRLTFGEPCAHGGKPLRTTLGGTGLAVSSLRPHRAEALAYAQFAADPVIQRTLHVAAGGQPGHRTAWLDPENNRLTNDTFRRTLPSLDRSYLRPRYSGYLEFQERGGPLIHAALRGTMAANAALAQLDAVYQSSIKAAGIVT